jgi:hypothetical protein
MAEAAGVLEPGRGERRPFATAKPKALPWDKVTSSQARDDHLATLLYDERLNGTQRQALRQLMKLQKAALRLRVMALPLAHKAGYLVRAADARERQQAGKGRLRPGGQIPIG